jgi:DNA polymerase-3 subunit gamma/tau
MSYQVIARKYRPQRFEEVVGQEHVTQTLSRAIEQKRIAHAYLFCGPRGTGKTTIARIFAKCLNCTGGPKVDFDEKDPRCQEIAEGRSLDVLEIDAASNRGIDEIRGLREAVKYAPASSKFKIYIIDEVHMLTKEAFNALLKTLEEPPAHVKFMFATTEPEKVLLTILSRCQRFDLRRIPSALIVKHLAHVATQENVTIDQEALSAIARGAEGAMRDAESTLDQLISFCGNHIEEADVLSMFGLTAQTQLMDLSRAILAGELETALRQLNELANNGKDLGRLLGDLLNHFRNLLIFQIARGDLSMFEISEAEVAALGAQSKMASSEGLTRILEILGEAELRLREVASKKILVEVTVLKAIEARNTVSLDSVLQQLKELRETNVPERVLLPSPVKPAAPPRPGPIRAEAVAAVEVPLAPASVVPEVFEPAPSVSGAPPDLAEIWAKLLEGVGRVSQFTRSYLLEAHPVSFARNLFTIGFDPEFEEHIGLVDNPRNHTLLQTKLSELGYPNTQLKFIKAETPKPLVQAPENPPTPDLVTPRTPGPTRSAAPSPPKERLVHSSFDKDSFKNDPLIQKALEVFKGQVVEVRV